MWKSMAWTVTAVLTMKSAKDRSTVVSTSPRSIPFFNETDAQSVEPFNEIWVNATLDKYDECEKDATADPCFFERSLSRDETRLPLKPSHDAPEPEDQVELLPVSISPSNVSSNVGLIQVLKELREIYAVPAGERRYQGYRVIVADVAIYKRILKVDFKPFCSQTRYICIR